MKVRRIRLLTVLTLLLGNCILQAQDTLRDAFTFHYQNDFFNATDRYLTQEVTLAYQAPFVQRLPTARVLLRLKDSPLQGSLALRQQCYTPRSIRRDTIFTGERPFAAAFYAQHLITSANEVRGLRLTSTLSLGVLGPCAVCAEEQQGIHRALDNITPLGWQFQVENTPLVNYSVQLEKRWWRSPLAEVSSGAGAEIGTYHTNAVVRGRVELGKFRSHFTIPVVQDGKLRFSVALTGEAKGVAYDATLQGALIGDASPYVLPSSAVSRVVLRGGWEAMLAYKHVHLSFNRVYLTREFAGGLAHGWGGIQFRWSW